MNTSLTALITTFFYKVSYKYSWVFRKYYKSYRDTFVLLFLYADEHKLCPRGRINISIFNRENITGFLDWLETSRNVSVSTKKPTVGCFKIVLQIRLIKHGRTS